MDQTLVSPGIDALNTLATSFVVAIRTSWLTEAMIIITDFGSPQNFVMLSLVVLCLYWLHGKKYHATQFLFTMCVSAFLGWLIKLIVQLPRPLNGLIVETGYSFASNHALVATVFLTLVVYSFKSHIKQIILRRLFIGACGLMIFLIGFSRVYLGVHYASDVLAGFTIGFILASLSIIIFELRYKEIA